MKHGELEECGNCSHLRLSVVEQAEAVILEHGDSTAEGRVARSFLTFLSAYAEMISVREQIDLVYRIPCHTGVKPDETEYDLAERLRAMYMVRTSKCTHEFGANKCTEEDLHNDNL